MAPLLKYSRARPSGRHTRVEQEGAGARPRGFTWDVGWAASGAAGADWGGGDLGEKHAGEGTGDQTVTSVSRESRGPTYVSLVYTPERSPLCPGR